MKFSFTLASGHPRLWLRSRELQRFLRDSKGFRRNLRKKLFSALDAVLANPEADPYWTTGPNHVALALGQAWRMTGDERYGRAAWQLYESIEPQVASNGGYSAWGTAAETAAILYDWLHPYWVQRGLEKEAATATLLCARRALDDLLTRYIVDDWHNYGLGLQSGILAAALAIGHDHPALENGVLLRAIEQLHHTGYHYTATRIQDMHHTPPTLMNLGAAIADNPSCLWEASGAYHRIDARAIVLMAEMWTRAAADSRRVIWPELARAGEAILHTTRPGGTVMTWADAVTERFGWRGADVLCLLQARTPRPHFAEKLREWDMERNHPFPVFQLLYATREMFSSSAASRKAKATGAVASLPLADHVGRIVTMRSGWKPTDTFVSFSCGDYGGWHNHHDWNTFTIFRGGELAVDTPGCYYIGPHRSNYQMRTIAHNGILVRNPKEKFWIGRYGKPVPNDGGHRFVSLSYSPPNDRTGGPHAALTIDRRIRFRDEFNMGKLVAFEPDESFDYVAGDATRAYTYPWSGIGDNPSRRVEEAVRQIVFLKPDWIIIFDRVEATRAEYLKTWLLHTINAPRWFAPRAGKAKPGITKLPPQGPFEFEQEDGRMTVWPLLPQARTVRVVGGPGYECWINDVDGVARNAPPKERTPGSANWRLEISPARPSVRDCFLTIIHAGLRKSPPVRDQYDFSVTADKDSCECHIRRRKTRSDIVRVKFGVAGPITAEIEIPGEAAYHRNNAPERVPQAAKRT